MKLKKYVLTESNELFATNGTSFEQDGRYCEREPFNSKVYATDYGKIQAQSDNILDLAREGDLVIWFGSIFELYLDEGQLMFNSDGYTQWFEEGTKNITMLYKKAGNNFIGYEVK